MKKVILALSMLILTTGFLSALEADKSLQNQGKDSKEFSMYCSLCKRNVMVPHHCSKAK